jgi:hypothetical protein
MKNPFAFFQNPPKTIEIKTSAPTPIPKNFVFNASEFMHNYRKTSYHGNCKCDTCISELMEKYVRQVLVQPTIIDKFKDEVAAKITWAEEMIHNKEDNEKILNWLLDQLRRLT